MDELEWGLRRIQSEGGGERRYRGMCEVFADWHDSPSSRWERFLTMLTRVVRRDDDGHCRKHERR